MIAKNQQRWVGHVHRMSEDRYPRKVLYGQLADGGRPAHGPKKRYKDHLKKTIKSFNLLPENLETEAADRSGWRVACLRGAAHFEEERSRLRKARRRRRHEAREDRSHGVEDPSLVCSDCGRRCLSRIGLLSHRRVHRPGSERGRHVINGNVGLP